jgi:cysteine synthase A
MAQKLARELGLGVGISSGANLLGALQVLEREGWDATVVTIFCDDNKKYLSTDLAKPEPIRPGFVSTGVELLDFKTTLAPLLHTVDG